MSFVEKVSFKMMSFYHETLYNLFRNPYTVLKSAGLQKEQEVLEVGCGPGFFTVPAGEIIGEEGSLYTIDISPVAVDHVRDKVTKSPLDNITVLQANAAQTGFTDDQFDLVFVFGFGRAKGAGFDEIWEEIARVLKPTGLLSVEGRIKPTDSLFKFVGKQGQVKRFSHVEP